MFLPDLINFKNLNGKFYKINLLEKIVFLFILQRDSGIPLIKEGKVVGIFIFFKNLHIPNCYMFLKASTLIREDTWEPI